MGWIKDIISPQTRKWEEFYRNRFQHDRVVRSTHGVNCTGGCSWQIHVKDGIVTWETQQLDYPLLEDSLPPYEPRGCQRGMSYSWYLYSPLRIKYPLVRGALIDAYRAKKRETGDPMAAWKALQDDEEARRDYQKARGKGGFRRTTWEEVLEIMAVANISTAEEYGPDRVVGFSPIPAMSMLSYAAGSRFLQLFGGLNLSFYDWYCDLPTAFPEIWGEQTDVCESADWYNSKMIADMGANLNMTRTPDCHFFAEARHNGTKTVVFAPDFSQVSKFADQWVPLHAGSDGAYWMAVTHVILNEFHHKKKTPYFLDYVKQYTDSPHLVKLDKRDDGSLHPGRLLRASELSDYSDVDEGDWKFVNIDAESGEFVVPRGSSGCRWDDEDGNWSLEMRDSVSGEDYDPVLTLLERSDQVEEVEFTDFGLDNTASRGVPVMEVETEDGTELVTTIYDLIMAQYGVDRGLKGDYPSGYDDKDAAYTPAWQEIFTGVSGDTVLQFARQWGNTAESTGGKCMIIIGAGINHWYHANLMYRAGAMALMLTGCVGKNGGGLNHYVGQEKLAPVDAWGAVAFGKDWQSAVRLQQAPLWHYINTCQYRYDGHFKRYNTVPDNEMTQKHTADLIYKSVRMGNMPFFPQFDVNTLDLCEEAEVHGAQTNEEIEDYVLEKLKRKKVDYAVGDPEAESNFPRVWYIWRGNAVMGSMKGHEYCLKHYLGTHHNTIAGDSEDRTEDVVWRDEAPEGKMDLLVNLNFRMDSSALYCDIVLPAASWYEKADLNSTDLHSFIHPLSAAIPPVWESKTDWNIFRELAKATSEAAEEYFPGVKKDIIAGPISHDSSGEISQPHVKDWYEGECEAIPGETMHKLTVVERDYTKLYDKFITLGDRICDSGLGAHGTHYEIEDVFDEMVESNHFPVDQRNGKSLPSIEDAEQAANAILKLSTLTNSGLTKRAYEGIEKKTGQDLSDLSESGAHEGHLTYADLQAQPRRYNTSPVWSGLMNDGRAYAAYTQNVERLIPWRTLTGRQHFYLDHEMYLAFGENLPTYKPSPKPRAYGDLRKTLENDEARILNCLTPHGKWHIHSTYMENHRMLTLSRGCEPVWLSEPDAEAMDIQDNDWVEVHNDHGVYAARCTVSSRIPKGVCIVYHVPERTVSIPKSQVRDGERAGGHNSFTRIHLKPNFLAGGYGQFTYHFNYWGPIAPNRDTHVVIHKMTHVEF